MDSDRADLRRPLRGRCASTSPAPRQIVPAGVRVFAMFLLTRLLVLWGINILALIVVDWMFDGVQIGRWGPLLFGAFILMLGNAILKPILAILTLPLVIIVRPLVLRAQRADARARRVDRAAVLDRRLLDVHRRDDRRLVRQLRRGHASRSRARLALSNMTSYELWLFLHIAASIVWIGGAVAAQIFGVLAKRSGDPARAAALGKDMAFVGPKVFLPASVAVVVTGGLLTEDGTGAGMSPSSSSGSWAGQWWSGPRSATSRGRWARSGHVWQPKAEPRSPGGTQSARAHCPDLDPRPLRDRLHDGREDRHVNRFAHMSWFEFLLFTHIAMAVVWVGGGLMMQFFGIRASMSGDPSRLAAFGQDVEWIAKPGVHPRLPPRVRDRHAAGRRVGLLRVRRQLDRDRARALRNDLLHRIAVPRT